MVIQKRIRKEKMTKQEIARRISKINWQDIQNGVPSEVVILIYIQKELELLSKRDAIELLLNIIEANELSKLTSKFYGDMLEFNFIK